MKRPLGDRPLAVGGPFQPVIVENDQLPVDTVDVDFDPGDPHFKGLADRKQGVLRRMPHRAAVSDAF